MLFLFPLPHPFPLPPCLAVAEPSTCTATARTTVPVSAPIQNPAARQTPPSPESPLPPRLCHLEPFVAPVQCLPNVLQLVLNTLPDYVVNSAPGVQVVHRDAVGL